MEGKSPLNGNRLSGEELFYDQGRKDYEKLWKNIRKVAKKDA